MPLLNAQYDAVMREYDAIRERHRHELEDRTDEVYAKIPEFEQLNGEVAELSFENAKRRIFNPNYDLAGYEARLKEISALRKQLLLANGYPADYLDETYDCPDCHDTGYVGGKRCACFKKKAIRLLYDQYSLSDVLETDNFSHFSFEWYSDTIKSAATGKSERQMAEDAVEAARQFVGNMGKPDNNLFLYGNTGVGKTFLSHCIAKEVIEQSWSALYFTSHDFFDILAGAEFSRSEEKSSYGSMILNADLLIIDDLGTELTNAFVGTQLFRVVNDRIIAGRSTIISTNLMLNEFSEKYTERVFSRIMSHYRIVKMEGKDIRIQKKLKGGRT